VRLLLDEMLRVIRAFIWRPGPVLSVAVWALAVGLMRLGSGIRGCVSGSTFGEGCGEHAGSNVVIVVESGGGLARWGRRMRPAYWTRRP
jgi:hypothetical protein